MSRSLFSSRRTAGASRARGRRTGLETLEPRVVLNGTVVFNEINYHPADGDDSQEWVELHSLNTVEFDLSNWTLRGGADFDFPEGTILPALGYLVIAADPDALEATSDIISVAPKSSAAAIISDIIALGTGRLGDPNPSARPAVAALWPLIPSRIHELLGKLAKTFDS